MKLSFVLSAVFAAAITVEMIVLRSLRRDVVAYRSPWEQA